MTLRVGDRLGSYEIIGALGAGGMGEVYRAHDDRLRREVAIKPTRWRRIRRDERASSAKPGRSRP